MSKQSDLIAIAPQAPVSAVVKPLEWVTTHETLQSANTIVGWYTIDRRLPLGWYWKHSGDYLAGPLRTEDEAKAAAKADYEKRILSALASPPPPAQADDGKDAEIERLTAQLKLMSMTAIGAEKEADDAHALIRDLVAALATLVDAHDPIKKPKTAQSRMEAMDERHDLIKHAFAKARATLNRAKAQGFEP